jgi:outer membrane protein OmpA-like peptidoglycan-associated protein
MKRWLVGLFVALLFAAPAGGAAGERIGVVRNVEGSVSIVRDGSTQAANPGDTLLRGDVIRTGTPGTVGLVLDDETTVSLGSGSALALHVYSFDPREGRFAFVARMARGTFSYLAGLIGKLAPRTIQLQLPDATIAVRGTRLLVECAELRQAIVLIPDPDGRLGEVEVRTAGGAQRLTRADDLTTVSGSAPPAEVTTADPAWLAATFNETLGAAPPPSEKSILYFEEGTTTPDARSMEAIPEIAASARRRGIASVLVSGHADATGSDELNDALARARAETVKALLVERGVPADRIRVSSHGKANPAVPAAEGVAEPRNRRVEVLVQ